MTEPRYDADYIRRRYDAYAEREWTRFEQKPFRRVDLFIHQHYLHHYIHAGDSVLDIGGGPGRFTIELAKLGARVTVGDISPVQLALNREKVGEAGYEASVVSRAVMDVTDLSRFAAASFDAVVCYGGALSYVFERADDAVAELLRVTRPGGHLLVSVMSLLGSIHAFLPGVMRITHDAGVAPMQRLIESGDQFEEPVAEGHLLHFYRSHELQALLERQGGEVVALSASNFLAVGYDALLTEIVEDDALWEALLRWELEFCQKPGSVDGGTHLIAVARHREGAH
jgi:ubiquinone/menaquinone biosynthesis C-methylase UbiE